MAKKNDWYLSATKNQERSDKKAPWTGNIVGPQNTRAASEMVWTRVKNESRKITIRSVTYENTWAEN